MAPGTHSDFRLLWVGGLFSSFGAQVTAVALPLLVLRLHGSAAEAGLAGAIVAGTMVLAMVPAGVVVDLVARRTVALVSEVVAGLTAVAVCAVSAAPHPSVPALLALCVVQGVVGAFYLPAATALLKSVVPAERMASAAARLQSRTALARLAGPVCGGALLGVGRVLPFLVEALALTVSAYCLWRVRTRESGPGGDRPVFGKQALASGFRFVWRDRRLRLVLLLFGLGVNTAYGALLLAALTTTAREGSATAGGLITSLAAAGSLLGALVAERCARMLSLRVLVVGTCGTCAAASGAAALWPGPAVTGAAVAVTALVGAVTSVTFVSFLLVVTPAEMLGRVQSAAGTLSAVAQPLGPFAGGLSVDTMGRGATFLALGIVFALCALIGLGVREHAHTAAADRGSACGESADRLPARE